MNGKLLSEELSILVDNSPYITCVCFMGGDAYKSDVVKLAEFVKIIKGKKVAVYSGDDNIYEPYVSCMDYYKLGSYQEDKGPLNNPNTNQKLFKIVDGEMEDITNKFWRRLNEEV